MHIVFRISSKGNLTKTTLYIMHIKGSTAEELKKLRAQGLLNIF